MRKKKNTTSKKCQNGNAGVPPISNGMKNQETQQHNNLKSSVLARLQREDIAPTSLLFWKCQECTLWMLWGLSICVGAIATAVVIFASMHAGFALYEATHASPLAFVIEVLPFVWFGIFVVMALSAYYNFRHTRTGYRYSLSLVVGSSVALSIVGGLLLHTVGAGYAIDSFLGKNAPMYDSQEEMELALWQQPEHGRMVGYAVNGNIALIEDVEGKIWTLEVEDLRAPDIQTLQSGQKVRILGIQTSTSSSTIHGCGIFPWMFDASVRLTDLQEDRREFIERMYAHKDRYEERLAALDEETYGDTAMGICAEMPTVERIGNSMQ